MRAFQKYLLDRNFVAVVRRSRGLDILGACGQLATHESRFINPAANSPIARPPGFC